MNLTSSLFDKIRIPSRRTPDKIGRAVCQELGIDVTLVRSGKLTSRHGDSVSRRAARCAVAKAIRNAGYPIETVAAWFEGVSVRTVHDYLYERAYVERPSEGATP